jgi:hypothetical protein
MVDLVDAWPDGLKMLQESSRRVPTTALVEQAELVGPNPSRQAFQHIEMPLEPPRSQPSVADDGALDLAAFGMDLPPPEPPRRQPSAADSGALDLAAFGMALPLPEPPRQQPSAADSGALDLAAFGMALPLPEPPRQQPSAADSGTLNLAAFGMALPPAVSGPSGPHSAFSGESTEALAPLALVAPGSAVSSSLQPNAAPLLEPPLQSRWSASQLGQADVHLLSSLRVQACKAGAGDSLGIDVAAAHDPPAAAPLPGLTAAETSQVLALAEALAASLPSVAGETLDEAAGRYLSELTLACADLAAARASFPAAAPSSCSGGEQLRQPSVETGGSCVAGPPQLAPQGRWGLLPGLRWSSIMWALLSGELVSCAS